jgi:hypothetical protein
MRAICGLAIFLLIAVVYLQVLGLLVAARLHVLHIVVRG